MTKARTLADNFAADINGITAGTGISGGGTSGTVTVTNSMATTIDAKGDLVVGTGADTFSRLAVASTAGYLLSVDSAEATGLKWAAPAGGGKLLQVVSGASTGYIAITTVNTYGDTNLSLSITPTLATSKILILVTQMLGSYQNSASIMNKAFARIMRGATAIWTSDINSSNGKVWTSGAYADTTHNTLTFHYLDSPATTSATTYKTQFKQTDNSNDHTLYMNYGDFPSQITLMEIGA